MSGNIFAGDHNSTSLVIPPKSHAFIRKATSTHLFMAVGLETSVSNPQGTSVTKLIALDDTASSEDDDELTVYGINAGENEIIYNTSLINIEIYRGRPDSKEALGNPRGITSNEYGDVYVADTGNRRVVRLFNRQGKKLEYLYSSSPSIRDFSPFDVALREDGNVFVSDSAGSRIWLWYPEKNRWEIVIKQIPDPLGIVTYDRGDRWTYYNSNRLGIVYANGEEVLVTDYAGANIAQYKPQENKSRFRYIAVDYYGNFYMTDLGLNRIVKIDYNCKFVDSIGEQGKGRYQFLNPQGISIWKRYGQVCVAESYAAQYYLIGTDIKNLTLEQIDKKLQVLFRLTERARVTISLNSYNGQSIQLLSDRIIQQGDFAHTWDIPDSLEHGEYTVNLSAQPYYSSTKYFTASRTIEWSYKSDISE